MFSYPYIRIVFNVVPSFVVIVNIIYSNEMRIAKIIPNSELGKYIVGEINLIYNG